MQQVAYFISVNSFVLTNTHFSSARSLFTRFSSLRVTNFDYYSAILYFFTQQIQFCSLFCSPQLILRSNDTQKCNFFFNYDSLGSFHGCIFVVHAVFVIVSAFLLHTHTDEIHSQLKSRKLDRTTNFTIFAVHFWNNKICRSREVEGFARNPTES